MILHEEEEKNVYGHNLLHKAVINENKQHIMSLIANKYNKDIPDSTGFTATELAIILKKEWLIPFIDGLQTIENEKSLDDITAGNTENVETNLTDFQQRLLKRRHMKCKIQKLHGERNITKNTLENRKKLTPHRNSVDKRYRKDSDSLHDKQKEEKLNDKSNTTLSTMLNEKDERKFSEESSSDMNTLQYDILSDSGLSTLRSVDEHVFENDDKENNKNKDLESFDELMTTQSWIDNKGSSYDLNNNDTTLLACNDVMWETGITDHIKEQNQSKLHLANPIISTSSTPCEINTSQHDCLKYIQHQKRGENFHEQLENITTKGLRQKIDFRPNQYNTKKRRNKLVRSNSWPFLCKKYSNTNKKTMEEWEVWEFGEENTKSEQNEPKDKSSSDNDDIFHSSYEEDSKSFTASYRLDDDEGHQKDLYVLSSSHQSLNGSNLDLSIVDSRSKVRSISESHSPNLPTHDNKGFEISGKERKGFFSSLKKSRSSSELFKPVEKPKQKSDDPKGFSKSFQADVSPKKKGLFSFFSGLKKSTSSNELRVSRSRTSSTSSEDPRGFNRSISVDPLTGEEKHVLVVPTLHSSPNETSSPIKKRSSSTSSSVEKNSRKNSLEENGRNNRTTIRDSGYFSPDENKQLRYSITFTPEESKQNERKKERTPSSSMTSLQQGLLPLVVGVGLGEGENTTNVVTDVVSPHTVEEHGSFNLCGGESNKINNENNTVNIKSSEQLKNNNHLVTDNKMEKRDERGKLEKNDSEDFLVVNDADYSYPRACSTPSFTEENNETNSIQENEVNTESENESKDTAKRQLHFFETHDTDNTDGFHLGTVSGKLPSFDVLKTNENPSIKEDKSLEDDAGTFTVFHCETTNTTEESEGTNSQKSSASSERSRGYDYEPTHLEDSTASFEQHEIEYEIGCLPSPVHGPSFGFSGQTRLADVIEESSLSDEEDKFAEDYDLKSERKMTLDLLSYMPAIMETEEENKTLNETPNDDINDEEKGTSQDVDVKNQEDGQVVTRLLSAENLRLHDKENTTRTKEDYLNDFVNIVIQNDEEHDEEEEEEIITTKNNKEREEIFRSSTSEEEKPLIEEETQGKDIDKIESKNHKLKSDKKEVPTTNDQVTEDSNEKEGPSSDEDMNRNSHDTFSVEFHVPVDSNPLLTSPKPQNKAVETTTSKTDQKKCLWYDYSQESTTDNETSSLNEKTLQYKDGYIPSEDDSPRLQRPLTKQKALTRDASLAWDGLVDVYTEVYEHDEEKLDVIVDFEANETLHEVLPNDINKLPHDHIDDKLTTATNNDDDDDDDDDGNSSRLDSKLSKSSELSNSYLRLTPLGILSDEEAATDNDNNDDGENEFEYENDTFDLIDNLDRHYEKISSDKIVENIFTEPMLKSNESSDLSDITVTQPVRCSSIILAPLPYRSSYKQHDQHRVEEDHVEKTILENYSLNIDFEQMLDKSTEDEDELNITKRIYRRQRSPLKTQQTEDFTHVDTENTHHMTRKEANRKKLEQYQTTEEFTEVDDVSLNNKRNALKTQQTESFVVISDESDNDDDDDDENSNSSSMSERYGSQLNLNDDTNAFTDSPPSSAVSSLVSGVIRLLSHENDKTIELQETSVHHDGDNHKHDDGEPQETSEHHDGDKLDNKLQEQYEDEDSGMDLLSEDLNHGLSMESLVSPTPAIDYDEWLSQLTPTLNNPEKVTNLYLELADIYHNKHPSETMYDHEQVIRGKLVYWLVVENDLCNFSSVVSYLLTYMGLIKTEKELTRTVKVGKLLQFIKAVIKESHMLARHLDIFTCFLIRPCRHLRKHHNTRLEFLQTCFQEQLRQLQLQSSSIMTNLAFCFMKISEYFVFVDADLTLKMTEDYLLPHLSEQYHIDFIKSALQYMNLLKSTDKTQRTTLDLNSTFHLLELILSKASPTQESLLLLQSHVEGIPLKDVQFSSLEKTNLLNTLQKLILSQ